MELKIVASRTSNSLWWIYVGLCENMFEAAPHVELFCQMVHYNNSNAKVELLVVVELKKKKVASL